MRIVGEGRPARRFEAVDMLVPKEIGCIYTYIEKVNIPHIPIIQSINRNSRFFYQPSHHLSPPPSYTIHSEHSILWFLHSFLFFNEFILIKVCLVTSCFQSIFWYHISYVNFIVWLCWKYLLYCFLVHINWRLIYMKPLNEKMGVVDSLWYHFGGLNG